MTPELSTELELLLVLISFFSGVGITAIGPGGIFVIIALYSLTGLSPATVAGTASAMMVAAGTIGSAIYFRSGELKDPSSRRLAAVLSATSVLGGLTGSWLNGFVSEAAFGALLGLVAVGAGAVIIYQEWRQLVPRFQLDLRSWRGWIPLAALGLGIGIAGGLLGVGGPVLAVPALVVLGIPILLAVAVAQVQSVFIATFATASYVMQEAVAWPLAAIMGFPLVVGVIVGWTVARRIEPRRLKIALGIVLLALGPYLGF